MASAAHPTAPTSGPPQTRQAPDSHVPLTSPSHRSHPSSSHSQHANPPTSQSSNRPSLFTASSPRKPRRLPINPQNFTPRSPPLPNVPLSPKETPDEATLLTVPEQRRSRQSLQSLRNPSSLNVELESSHDLSATDSIPLPTTLRKGKSPVTPWDAMPPPDNQAALPAVPLGSGDVEAGGERRLRHTTSKISLPAMASEGALPEGTAEEESMMEWGPMHPCYPHLNPHVVESDPKYVTTRIVRVPRDWMVKGDLAVTFANVYPEVLDGLVTEEEFRDVLRHINEEMMAAFDPFSWHSFVDTVLGIATFWLYDWTGLSFHKRKLKALDAWIARWNHDVGAKNDVEIISLLRSSYMSIDFQIPDPQLSPDPVSRPATRANEAPQLAPIQPSFQPEKPLQLTPPDADPTTTGADTPVAPPEAAKTG